MMKGKAVAIPGLRNKLIPIAARLTPRLADRGAVAPGRAARRTGLRA